jgi:TM2 domain-containing membrane protein YozV
VLATLSDHELAFYSTVAQVTPVFILALALEVKASTWLGPTNSNLLRIIMVTGIMLGVAAMFGGEWAAVDTLMNGKPGWGAPTLARAGFIAGLLLVFFGAVELVATDIGQRLAPRPRAAPVVEADQQRD